MSAHAERLLRLAAQLGEELRRRKLVLASAESCTAGGVAYAITQVPGSSQWYERGWIVYSNLSKQELLDVPGGLLLEFGAVSEPVAQAMAQGALGRSAAQAALAVTGIAGPDGGTPAKPVGTVCFSWALRKPDGVPLLRSRTLHFSGDRAAVRTQAIAASLEGMAEILKQS
jgi:nicotinamide-nucleotide amidase